MNNSAGFTHVVDLSVAYEGCRERPSEKSVFWNGDCPSDMHVLVESATAETVAVDSELFLRDSFLRKEALFQEWFARGGDEVLGSRGNSSGWYSPVRTEEEEETSFQRAYAAVSCSEKVVSSPGKGNKSRSSEKNTSIVRVRYDDTLSLLRVFVLWLVLNIITLSFMVKWPMESVVVFLAGCGSLAADSEKLDMSIVVGLLGMGIGRAVW